MACPETLMGEKQNYEAGSLSRDRLIEVEYIDFQLLCPRSQWCRKRRLMSWGALIYRSVGPDARKSEPHPSLLSRVGKPLSERQMILILVGINQGRSIQR